MIGWVILGFYCLGYVLMWRTVVWALVNDMTFGSRPAGDDIAFAILCGSLITFFWPFIFSALLVRRIYRAQGKDALVVLMPRSIRMGQKLAARQAKIERLERELGIGRK